jgi:hypothetical protein
MGQLTTYGDLAEQVGNPKALVQWVRQWGNPVAFLILVIESFKPQAYSVNIIGVKVEKWR